MTGTDRIFAQATPPGRSGLAVLRISGPGTRAVLAPLCGPLPGNGRSLRTLRDASGAMLDQALVLIFPAGASYTGEETVELHLHGSLAVVRSVLGWLHAAPGCRAAEAGEFTRRALENGRLDFAQVEGLADLIDAETEAQRRQAVRVMSGELGRKAAHWRAGLLQVSALLAATIDFADEDLPDDLNAEIRSLLGGLVAELKAESDGVLIAERVRDGFEVAIVGAPNVGKSTLLNRLAGREAALISDIAGTTRDVLEVRTEIAGLPVTLLDMAGLRESDDRLESMGIERARVRAGQADVRIHLIGDPSAHNIEPRPGDIVVQAKADLGQVTAAAVSGLTGEGVDGMLRRLTERLLQLTAGIGTATRERHRQAMQAAAGHLEAAIGLLGSAPAQEDQAAEEVRSAVRSLDSLVGRVDLEDVLGQVFSRFCIGK